MSEKQITNAEWIEVCEKSIAWFNLHTMNYMKERLGEFNQCAFCRKIGLSTRTGFLKDEPESCDACPLGIAGHKASCATLSEYKALSDSIDEQDKDKFSEAKQAVILYLENLKQQLKAKGANNVYKK